MALTLALSPYRQGSRQTPEWGEGNFSIDATPDVLLLCYPRPLAGEGAIERTVFMVSLR